MRRKDREVTELAQIEEILKTWDLLLLINK